MTGRQILIPSAISETIKPTKMYSTGNYALSVDWSDGHRSLYPYRQIKSLMEAKKAEAAKLQEV
jgi:ATP-binding protein involved in chromosome partitioning